jgi:hypothetical protein
MANLIRFYKFKNYLSAGFAGIAAIAFSFIDDDLIVLFLFLAVWFVAFMIGLVFLEKKKPDCETEVSEKIEVLFKPSTFIFMMVGLVFALLIQLALPEFSDRSMFLWSLALFTMGVGVMGFTLGAVRRVRDINDI